MKNFDLEHTTRVFFQRILLNKDTVQLFNNYFATNLSSLFLSSPERCSLGWPSSRTPTGFKSWETCHQGCRPLTIRWVILHYWRKSSWTRSASRWSPTSSRCPWRGSWPRNIDIRYEWKKGQFTSKNIATTTINMFSVVGSSNFIG